MSTLTAVDLFAGAGGATAGLKAAGLTVLGAVENDRDAAASYRLNHPRTLLVEADIRTVRASVLRRKLRLRRGALDLLKACPPCQGFSSLAKGAVDEARNDLVLDVVRFVIEFRPKVVLLENVPGLSKDHRLQDVITQLAEHDYTFQKYIVDASTLGVPQRRKRLIAIGLRKSVKYMLPESFAALLPDHRKIRQVTVRQAFARLDRYQRADDPLNRHRISTAIVQERIEAVPINGTRFDLPLRLQLDCHKKLSGRRATSSYGRLRLDEPSPTMTTRCTTPACGAFIHPTEHRGITLREAATLQTFPYKYNFVGKYESIERQIGNAVPVRMAEMLGTAVKRLLSPTL